MILFRYLFGFFSVIIMGAFVIGNVLSYINQRRPSDRLQAAVGICIAIFWGGAVLAVIPFFLMIFTN